MSELASIEGGDIVIRVPIGSLPTAAEVAFDEAYCCEEHDCRVSDPQLAAEAIVRALNHEEEDGTTPVNSLLDAATIRAFEEGEEGFEGGVFAEAEPSE